MPRKPGVYFYRGHFVTKFGCGDGPPVKLVAAKGKSDREAKQAAETELRRLVVERDQNRTAPKPVSQITVEDLVIKFLERTKAERQSATHDYAAMLRKLVYGSRGSACRGRRESRSPTKLTLRGRRSRTASASRGPAT